MTKHILLLLFWILSLSAYAQQTSIKGKVTDYSDSPLVGVSVYLKNTTTGTQTDDTGSFTLNNDLTGDHTLVLSYIGYKTREIAVNLEAGKTLDVTAVVLYEGNEILSQVVVKGERLNKFSRKRTAYVSKLPLSDLENAQVYSTISTELLESQVVTNLDDAMKNAAGVNKLWEATGRSGAGTSYYSMRGFSGQPNFINGLPGFTFSALDPSYIERIEVIKGPTATLFGSTAPSLGGLINVVTKTPYEGFGGSVSYTTGSFNTHRVSADINTAISEKNKIYFRLTSSYLTQESFQDAGFKKTFFVAPSISYRLNNRLNLSAGVEYSRARQTNPLMAFLRRGYPMVSTNLDDLGLDPNKSFTSDDIYLTVPTISTRFIGDYKISDTWTSQTVVATSHVESKGYYQYIIEGAGVSLLASPDPVLQGFAQLLVENDIFTRFIDKRDENRATFDVQQNFTGDFNIGKVRNRVVVGLDYLVQQRESNNKFSNPALPGFPFFDAFFLANGDVFPTPLTPDAAYEPSQAKLDPIFEQIEAVNVETKSQTFAAYISDVINISPNLSVMAGLRLNYFDQEGNTKVKEDDYTKTTLSPTAGIVYQPILDKLSVFANYQTGFLNINPTVLPNGTVQTFEPLETQQLEFGVKSNIFDGRLNAGVSYYNMTVDNMTVGDPNDPLANVRLVVDQTTSQGLELEINANPINGLNIRASYAYNDTKINDTDIAALKDRRPESAGPESIYNFWVDYKLQADNFLNNIGIGAGFNGTSELLVMNNGVSGEFALPAYTVLNAAIYYDAESFRIGLKANNITDEEYYTGWSTINPQAPAAFLATIAYKF